MRFISILPAALAMLFAASCSQAQSDKITEQPYAAQGSHPAGDDRHKDKKAAEEVPGLRKVGSIKREVPESSGLAVATNNQNYYSFGDDGNLPRLYEITATGALVRTIDVPADNHDWESLSRDNSGTYYIGDCGNNNNDRHDLRLITFRPDQPQTAGIINFTYPDQREFPPKKKQRNFDCEASLWHDGQVYLFTKDRAQETTSKVYTVPEKPGTYTARKITDIAIPGQVTDAALRPDGRRLVLLGRGELFMLDGTSWADILKAKPQRVDLNGAGQTEGAVFKDQHTLLITTEKGDVYEYTMP